MSTFAARLQSCAVVLLLTLGVGCKERPEQAAPPPLTTVQSPEVDCAPEGVRPSELVYVGAAHATYGVPVTVAARLMDAAGRPLVGREVLLRLGEQSQQVVTDAVGLARTQLMPPGPAGTLEVFAHFAGDAEYTASSVSAPFLLERAPTLLRLVGPTLLATDVAQPLLARLVRLDDSQPVTGRRLTFTAGTFSASAVTDAAGEAHVSLPPGVATGTLRVHATFAGDGYFAPSQDSGDVLLYLPTAFSIWGGNSPGLKLGDRVNFWGHSWAKQVLGGDYDAHSDHKGWAPGLAVYGLCQPDARTGGATPELTPGCWSSKTGNSFPPATLPEYIGVIVTTAVAKTQGQVYGNVAAVAVVKVDPKPAYGPVPGKPGFGTLVAVVAASGSSGLPGPALLSATQRQPTLVSPGESYTVTLDVGNASTTAALDVVATEHFSGGSTPTETTKALGTLAGNATLSQAFAQTAPALAPRGTSEPEADYLARLAALDGQPLMASGSVRYVDPTGAPTRPLNARSWSRVRIPRLVLGVSTANCAQPCGTITYTLQATNLGLGKSPTTTATLRLPDGTERTLALGELQPGESRSAQVEWALPPISPRGENETLEEYLERLRAADGASHPAHATLTWTDAVGGTYGPLARDVGTTTRLPVLSVLADGPLSVLPGETFTATFRVANFGTAEVQDAQLVVEGAAPIAPMNLAPGTTVSVPVTLSAPRVAPRAGNESEVDYLARLRASDRQVLAFPFRLDWAGACSTRFGPLTGSVKTARVLPVVVITLEGTAEAEAGDTLHYVASLENVGSAEAQGLVLTALLPDGRERHVAMPTGVLARGGALSVPFDFTLPSTTPAGTVTTVAQVVWQDGRAAAYGPLSARAETRVRQTNAPPVVDAGPDLTVTLPEVASPLGTATDDGRPAPLSTSWVQLSGPAPALIVDPTSLTTAVRFTVPGDYTFRLVGTDSEFTAQDEMVVHVRPRVGSGTTLPGGEQTPGEDVINVVREGNALRLDDTTRPFNFIWVAVSTKGTVVKLDTTTGNVLGEYWTAPANESKDPSRTTVDKNGNVWATNRANNSVVHIGLVENGQCQDRNGNGRIDTSTGYGDVRAWGASGTANNAAIATAADECILHYVKVRSSGTRHVSITEDNDVWVSGTGGGYFDLIDGRTGVIKRQEPSVGYGGYGGIIDRNGVIWSSASLMRWDTSKPLNGASGVNWKALPYASYGVCLAPDNNVWVTEYGAYVRKFAPDGTLLGTYYHGAGGAQGCVVAPNGDVWVAHSTGSTSVGHLKSDGRLVGTVSVGSGPTGVAVDGAGKVWATNYYSRTVSRIDPNKGAVWAGDGSTRVGQVDFTSRDLGGNLYNYSDMTGSTLSGAPENGTWSYVYDSGKVGSTWGKVAWLAEACGDASLKVSVQSSTSATGGFSPPVVVRSGVDFDVPAGRYLKVTVNFQRSTRGESPVLYNLTIATDNYVLEAPGINGPPNVSAGRNRTVTLPNVGRVTGSACDDALPAGGPLTLAWTQVSGPGTATFASPGQESTDVTFSAPGAYVLRLKASDGSLEGSAETTVTVEPLNLPPVVSVTGPAALALPDMALLSATLSDDGLPAGGVLTGTWSKVSGPGTVTFTNGSALDTQAGFSAPGAYVLRFTGFDGHLERTADLAMQVHAPPPVNAAPVVSAGPNLSVASGAQAHLNGSITDDGLPTASVTASWTSVSGPGTVTFTAPSSATTRASFSAAGTYVLRLTANDGALTASADVVVGVNTPAPTNTPPLVAAGPNRAVVLSSAATLDGNVTDDGLPNGTLSVTWVRQSGPGTVTFANASAPATTATFSAAGTYVLRLSANDGQFHAWSEMSVVVSSTTPSNQAPVVTVSPSRSITLPTRTASISGEATDDGLPTGSTLTYQWSVVSGPAGLVFTTPTQKTTTVSVTTPGAYRLRLTASDSRLTGSADTVLTVNAEADANQPPSIDPGPSLSVMQPANAVPLAGTATDDGRPTDSTLSVAWRKLSGPGTVTFADASSAATTAAFSTSGDYVLELSASDGEWRASGPKNVRVTPYVENKAPVVAASGPSQAALPDPVLLSGSVRDDGLPVTGALTLSWTKLSGPGTATFTRPTQASTYVSFSGPGDYVLRFSAHDGDKGASADVSVRAVQTNRAPSVSAGPSQSLAYPERVAQLSGSVSDDGLPEGSTPSLAWSVAGGPGGVTFADATAAQTSVTFSYPGSYLLRLTATDGEKSSASDTVVNVGAPEGPVPAVVLSVPADGASLTDVTPIRGSVSGGIWRVEACTRGSGTAPGACTVFASGEGPITDGQLGVFDPTMLLNGAYTVQVVAETSTGVSTAAASVVVEGDLKLGHFSVTFEDVSIPVMGIPITVTRTYDSRRSGRSLDFGHGWTVDYQNVRLQESRTIGLGWSLQQERSGFFSNWCVRPMGDPVVSIAMPDGKLEKFRAKASPECQFLVPVTDVEIVFEALPGTYSKLEQTGYGIVRLVGNQLMDLGEFDPADPDQYRLTTQDGTVYGIDQGFGIRHVSDLNGNTLTYTRDGVTHSSGVGVRFNRDSGGRIIDMQLPGGSSIHYAYDANGDLISVTDQVGSTSRYGYLQGRYAHYLQDIIDPRGVRVARNEYDAQGRLVAHIDANGARVEYDSDVASHTQTVRDRLGNATTYLFDAKGRVLRETNALGETTKRTYDTYGNELSRENAEGEVWRWEYDANGNKVRETNPLGQVSTWSYNSWGHVLTQTDASGRVTTSNAYNARTGQLTSITDPLGQRVDMAYSSTGGLTEMRQPLGRVTRYTYDDRGNKLREVNPGGFETVYTYDAGGRVLTETRTRTDENGVARTLVTRHAYDAKGRLVSTTDPLGHVVSVEYNAIDKEAARIDALGRRTEMAYDTSGNLVEVRFPDGTRETMAYDAENRVVARTDRAGRKTAMVYDAVGRLVQTRYPDGSVTRSTYDKAGREIARTDARGNVTTFAHDDAGRVVSTTNALGQTTTTTYNPDGTQASVSDAAGRVTRFVYDPAGRLIETIHPDSTPSDTDNPRSRVAYDALGRKSSETDELGRVTAFEYTALNQLAAVVDALGQRTSYAYDQLGNKIAQLDALGRVTRWAYDDNGREVARILPLGQRETRVYDANGNLIAQVDFNGARTVRSYDASDRLVEVRHADGSGVVNTYTPTGEVATRTDGAGTTTYTYDARDRLLGVAHPDGVTINYAYDAAGNRTRMVTGNQDVAYAYDALNRLSTVTRDGQTTAYTYDAVGNRATVTLPNGTRSEYAYDPRNRLRTLFHRTAAGAMLLGLTYTTDASGLRTQVVEQGVGETRTVVYQYDALKRLTGEQVTDGTRGDRTSAWTYDAVGNRLTETRTKASATVTTAYVYDANDRLEREQGSNGTVVAYQYDANGNVTTKTEAAGPSVYSYDGAGRLVSALTPAAGLSYRYDADGIRQSKTVNGVTTRYVVDPTAQYAQVIEERTSGAAPVLYLVGDDRIARTEARKTSYLHADGLGSTRLLTDASGGTSDRWWYEAFGETEAQSGTSTNAFLFAGEQRDPNLGFYYLRARYMDPASGRFFSFDPYAGNNADPITLHKYLYANANPVFYTDPSGWFGIGAIVDIGLSMNLQGITRVGNLQGGRIVMRQLLFGRPPDTLGVIGELVLDAMVNSVMDVIDLGDKFKNKGAAGTAAHQQLKEHMDDVAKRLREMKAHGITVHAEPFADDDGEHTGRGRKGSVGIDVLIKHNDQNVLAFDLKIGKGYTRDGIRKRRSYFGDVVQVHFDVTPSS